jgi:hypothetical protein
MPLGTQLVKRRSKKGHRFPGLPGTLGTMARKGNRHRRILGSYS